MRGEEQSESDEQLGHGSLLCRWAVMRLVFAWHRRNHQSLYPLWGWYTVYKNRVVDTKVVDTKMNVAASDSALSSLCIILDEADRGLKCAE